MGIGAWGVFKFDMGAGFLGFLSLVTGMIGFGSVVFSFVGIQGARLRRKEGYTECGQFFLLLYVFGIAGVIFVELAGVLFITFWCKNRVHELSAVLGPNVEETINYNLGNNLANCSFNDCCPNQVGFASYEVSPGIWELPPDNETWPAICVHVYDKLGDDEEFAPAPAPSPSNEIDDSVNASSPSSSSSRQAAADSNQQTQPGQGTTLSSSGSSPAPSNKVSDPVTPLSKVDLIGNRQMCSVFESVQTEENCRDFYLYEEAVKKYLWSVVAPLQTFLLVVIGIEFAGFVAAWFSLLWCCGAGSMKIDIDDSDDDEHEWHDNEHHEVNPKDLHHV